MNAFISWTAKQTNSALKNISVGISHNNRELRRLIASSLLDQGFAEPVCSQYLSGVLPDIQEGKVDVILCEMDGDIRENLNIVREIRHANIGKNPFFIIVALCANTEPAHIQQVINCGVDDIVITPVAMATLTKRIANFYTTRKQFVVTTEYIGPDRRQSNRDGNQPQFLDVPNPVAAKMSGMSEPEYDAVVRAMSKNLVRAKISTHAFEFMDIVRAIQTEAEVDLKVAMDRIHKGCHLVAAKLDQDSVVHKLCDELASLALRIANSDEPSSKDLRLLPEVGKALYKSFLVSDDTERDLAEEITDSLSMVV
jgi:CheY-like chemotaxis protein